MMNTRQTKPAWLFAGPLLLILLAFTLLLYQHTVLYLIGLWNQLAIGEYAHGYLVVAISIYLIFIQKQQLSALTPRPEYRALLLVTGASMLWLVSALVNVEMIQALSLLILVFALVWAVLGNQAIRLLAFPILFIIFAIPVWFPFSPFLQNITADVVFAAIRLLDIPAFRQDNMIMLPAGTMSIEEACSGLRYLLAALTLGTLYAYMNYSSLRARLVVVIVAACTAVLVNMLRVLIVVYLAYVTEMQHPLVHDHLTLGWYLFAGLTVVLLFIDSWLNKKHIAQSPDDTPDPDIIKTIPGSGNYPHYLLFSAITAVLILIAPLTALLVSSPSASAMNKPAPQLPSGAGAWVQVQPLANSDQWNPVYHGAVNQKQRYQKGKNTIDFYIGFYPVQKQGEELINDLNRIASKDRWRTVYPIPRSRNIDGRVVLEQRLKNDVNKQRLVWYWYNVAGTVTTNRYEAKILQVLAILRTKPWGYVAAVATDM
ncbi:MAG: EpsI family protein, partial [Gammaproteobacteria bacterium]|nr:EpsI family protein [Gammaproteobacteria bacterium]